MNLNFPKISLTGYTSNSQKIRLLSERWFSQYAYCPYCANKLTKFANNNPLGDFYCQNCGEEYELKSKASLSINIKKITDGEYYTKIKRLSSDSNPNLFFLTYKEKKVSNLVFVPRFYFSENIIEKRKPLSAKAKRAGWTGSNILISLIPAEGKLFVIDNFKTKNKTTVRRQLSAISFLKKQKPQKRGWTIDVLNCINKIKKVEFSLDEVYNFYGELKRTHPSNNNIRAKIRQQLQFLRDKKHIVFAGRGKYKKLQ